MRVHESWKARRPTLTELLRLRLKDVLDLVGSRLNRLGMAPNTLTLIGLAGTLGGAFLLARGDLAYGGGLILVMGLVDALDGPMARMRGMVSPFGAFVDSVSDRYSELSVYAGLTIYYLGRGDGNTVLLIIAAASGSVLVSYIKARAEGLGYEAGVGILTRMERLLLLSLGLVLGFAEIGLALIAVLGHVTALQRIAFVRRQSRRDGGPSG
jgi:CDP-diacylglycerol--glycerol-3-phosphate 3-phosphatidyltransferase